MHDPGLSQNESCRRETSMTDNKPGIPVQQEGNMELAGKVALITGASSGIGRATALYLAEAGADVVINYRKSKEASEEVAAEIEGIGRKAVAIQADVTKRKEVEEMVDVSLKTFGKLDILVNNAGGSVKKPVVEMEETEWDEIINFNLKGPFLCTRAVLLSMIQQRFGRIVNVSSNYGVTPAYERAHYAAAKAGLIAFTKSLAVEVAPYNINVNVVAPGPTDTPRWRRIQTEEQILARAREIPLGRVGQPEDAAKGILFLVSESSSYITGQTLHVNGGLVMP